MKEKIKIALFDDNRKIRTSFTAMLEGISTFELTGVFSDCSDLKDKIEKSNPHVILMDIEMPGIDGIEAVKQLQLYFPFFYSYFFVLFDFQLADLFITRQDL